MAVFRSYKTRTNRVKCKTYHDMSCCNGEPEEKGPQPAAKRQRALEQPDQQSSSGFKPYQRFRILETQREEITASYVQLTLDTAPEPAPELHTVFGIPKNDEDMQVPVVSRVVPASKPEKPTQKKKPVEIEEVFEDFALVLSSSTDEEVQAPVEEVVLSSSTDEEVQAPVEEAVLSSSTDEEVQAPVEGGVLSSSTDEEVQAPVEEVVLSSSTDEEVQAPVEEVVLSSFTDEEVQAPVEEVVLSSSHPGVPGTD
ncbi:probable serine/threonine-protein kinase kinX [Dreissena polymorpha]|uniref:probable serine/threonine-protein kinase kinX n=1 Tax=Dreissena polymorpha TaxID=45954 RepID=UPI0022640970|nr:probable serine/threonine-protein kinase kinX [Dreissena polymorpha]